MSLIKQMRTEEKER